MATQDHKPAQEERSTHGSNVYVPNIYISFHRLNVHRDSMTKESHEKQLRFVQWIKSSNKFHTIEKEAAECDSVEKLDTFLDDWKRAREDFDLRQQKGWGKCLRKYQHAAVSVQRYINDFKPFIEIIQTFLPPPANMAVGATIGTIAVFFVVSRTRILAVCELIRFGLDRK